MQNCVGCKHAEWLRTKTGRLSPTGYGECKYPYKTTKLPASMYWTRMSEPKPYGGSINRKKDLKEHCVYYEEE